jgi:hypothetical protein
MNTMNDIRELDAEEINLVAGAAPNPWIVRIAAKLIIAAIDHLAENGLGGGSNTPRHEREIHGKI